MIYFTLWNEDYPLKSRGGITPKFWHGLPQHQQTSRRKIPSCGMNYINSTYTGV